MEQMGTEAAILPSDGEYDVGYRVRESDRVRQDSDEQSVRTTAEKFVDNMFDDLTSTASISRLSLK